MNRELKRIVITLGFMAFGAVFYLALDFWLKFTLAHELGAFAFIAPLLAGAIFVIWKMVGVGMAKP